MPKNIFFQNTGLKKCLYCGLLLSMFLFFSCSKKSASLGTDFYDADVQASDARAELSESSGFAYGAPSAESRNGSELSAERLPETPPETGVQKARKLINRAELSVEAAPSLLDRDGRLSGANRNVEILLKQYGAYAEQSRLFDDSLYYKIRVPQNSYEALLSGMSVLGKVVSRNESAEDVTLKYYDLAGRLETKKTLQKTFHDYLSRAKNIEEIMKVETRIAELQNEIDWLGTELVHLGNMVDYATIELRIISYSVAPRSTLGDRIGGLFRSFGGFAESALLVALSIVVFVTPVIILCLFTFWLLFGRVGLLKKAFRLVLGPSPESPPKKDKT